MLGNVHEWCQEWYSTKYAAEAVTDPQGPNQGSFRVLRGGSWNDSTGVVRAAYRFNLPPDGRFRNVGCRLVVEM